MSSGGLVSEMTGYKRLYGLMILLSICWIFSMTVFILNDDIYVKKYRTQPQPASFTSFKRARTRAFNMVCFTHRNVKFDWSDRCDRGCWYSKKRTYTMFCRPCYHEQKIIDIYHSDDSDVIHDLNRQNFYKLLGFRLNFKHASQLPAHYTVIKNQTAYFLGQTGHPKEPYNFFHFTKQIFFPLYWLMKATNQLDDAAKNIVFYPAPYAICDHEKVFYHDIDKYKHFRDLLHIKNKLELSAYIDKAEPHKVCYKNAVFSTEFFLDRASEAIDYIKSSLYVQDNVCQPKTLTIINRSTYRRILNDRELKEIADSLGYNTKVVFMETMTLKEQAQLIHCTNILVGVAGAGLQWAYFMKNHSSVIEIAWPDKEWHFFFSSTGSYRSEEMDVIRPLKFVQLKATCQLNPPAINIYAKEMFHREPNITYEESLAILKDENNYDYMNYPVLSVGKLCDAMIDKDAFMKALLAA